LCLALFALTKKKPQGKIPWGCVFVHSHNTGHVMRNVALNDLSVPVGHVFSRINKFVQNKKPRQVALVFMLISITFGNPAILHSDFQV